MPQSRLAVANQSDNFASLSGRVSANKVVQQGDTQEIAPQVAKTKVFGERRPTFGGNNIASDGSSDPVGAVRVFLKYAD